MSALDSAGLTELLKIAASARQRRALARKKGVAGEALHKLVKWADFRRIAGISDEAALLLLRPGIDSVPEPGNRNAANLVKKMVYVNQEQGLKTLLPTQQDVAYWIEQARNLPAVLSF